MSQQRIQDIFGEGGALSQSLPGWEPRPPQQAMAAAVDACLDEGGVLLAEAGCGVGKSLAYLVPLLARLEDEGGTALVSTHTLNLQDQLLSKDVPAALKVLGGPALDVVQAQGRGNYLCGLRLSLFNPGGPSLPGFEDEHAGLFSRLADWAAREKEAVLGRLPFRVPAEAWQKVSVDADGCLGRRCPLAGRCHFLLSRERLRSASLVVANHALVFADLAARREGSGLLPDATWAVFDEAHHLEGVAAEHLGLRFSAGSLLKVLARLQPDRGPGLWQRAGGGSRGQEALGEAHRGLQALGRAMQALAAQAPQGGCLPVAEGRPLDDLASDALSACATELKALSEAQAEDALASELRAASLRLERGAASLKAWLDREDPGQVYWVEAGAPGAEAALRSALVAVDEVLPQELYPRHQSLVLTSATLSTQGTFTFLRRRLGLPEDARTLSLDSPFDFRRQVEMRLYPDLPDPRDEQAYLPGLAQALRQGLQVSQGRAFILFTSFRHLRAVAALLAPFCEEQGWELLSQGEGLSRERLLKRFKDSKGKAVLLGAASFWEGVDVPGEGLSLVAVCRLPFPVPDTPYEAARAARVEALGGSAFRDLHLPQAILRLKQGFGRLIRSHSDQGWFLLLDPRALRAGYGRAFLESLPRCRVVVEGREGMELSLGD
jgi:ATP-dependent DNA helicase DinG